MLLLDYLDVSNDKSRVLLNILGVFVFIIVFIGLTGEISNTTKSYMNKYIYQILFLILVYLICLSNKYLGFLGFLLFIIQFRNSCNEYFISYNSNSSITNKFLNKSNLPAEETNILNEDDIFKLDPVMKQQIFKIIRDQIAYDPYKTDLSRKTILDIYRKYFGEDQSLELQKSLGNSILYEPFKSL